MTESGPDVEAAPDRVTIGTQGDFMHRTPTRDLRALAASAVAALLLAACGGGGRGDPQNDRIAGVSPERSAVSCSADPGVACSDSLLARPADGQLHSEMTRAVTPAAGSAPAVDFLEHDTLPDGRWRIVVHFKRDLPAGTYTGTIAINVFSLFSSYRESTLQYTFTQAGALGDLRALAPLAGAGDWQTTGGNAAHAGAVPVTLDPATFSRRWTLDGTRGELSPPVTAAGRVLFTGTRLDNGATRSTLWAIDEASGGTAWSQPFTGLALDAPASAGQRVFITTSEAAGPTQRSFDTGAGVEHYASVTAWPSGAAPSRLAATPWAGGLYASDDAGGALSVRDAATGAAGWSVPLRDSLDPHFARWAPAVTDTQVYTNVNGRFRALARSSGSELFSLPVAGPTSGSLLTLHDLNQAPVVVDADSVLLLDRRRTDGSATANRLTMVDLPSRQVRWTADGFFTAHPVAAGGIVVVGNQQSEQVEARSVASGAVLWSWAPEHEDDETIRSLLLTNNLLFVSVGRRTTAIDLQTRQALWSYPLAGQLALSPNGLLYIATGDRVVAINVR